MRKIRQSFATRADYWLRVVSLGLVVGLGLQFAQAWTAPVLPPPGSSISGPLTASPVTQKKTGGLVLGGLNLLGYTNCDLKTNAVGTVSCGVDVAGAVGGDNLGNHMATGDLAMNHHSIINVQDILAEGIIKTTQDIYARKFYDINNAGYYVDPNGVSILNTLGVSGKVTSAATVESDSATTLATKGYVDWKVGALDWRVANVGDFGAVCKVIPNSSTSILFYGIISGSSYWKCCLLGNYNPSGMGGDGPIGPVCIEDYIAL